MSPRNHKLGATIDTRLAAYAALAGIALAVPALSKADIIYSGIVNISVPNNFDGVYINFVTGQTGTNRKQRSRLELESLQRRKRLTVFLEWQPKRWPYIGYYDICSIAQRDADQLGKQLHKYDFELGYRCLAARFQLLSRDSFYQFANQSNQLRLGALQYHRQYRVPGNHRRIWLRKYWFRHLYAIGPRVPRALDSGTARRNGSGCSRRARLAQTQDGLNKKSSVSAKPARIIFARILVSVLLAELLVPSKCLCSKYQLISGRRRRSVHCSWQQPIERGI